MSLFHLKSDKKNNLQSRLQNATINRCDTYTPNNRPRINWRILRWELVIGLETVLFKMSTDQEFSRSRVKGIVSPPVN